MDLSYHRLQLERLSRAPARQSGPGGQLPEAEIKDILDDIDVSRPDRLTAKVVSTRLQKAMIAAEFDEGAEPSSADERAIVAQMNEFAREDREKEQTPAA